jgi:hypothetical protein
VGILPNVWKIDPPRPRDFWGIWCDRYRQRLQNQQAEELGVNKIRLAMGRPRVGTTRLAVDGDDSLGFGSVRIDCIDLMPVHAVVRVRDVTTLVADC